MALLKYFKVEKRGPPLPDPCGSLNQQLSSSVIEEANKEVTAVLSAKRHPYLKISPEQKAIIARYAANHGIVKAIRQFSKDFPKDSLKESTIREWKKTYLKELSSRRKANKDMTIEKLPEKKTGRPLMLGDTLDKEVQAYIQETRKVGGVVNARIAIACATGILRRRNSNLLAVNGGHVVLTKEWARYLLHRLGYVKRKSNSKAKVTPTDFTQLQSNFLADIRAIVEMEEIPAALVINWDHTGLKYVPVSSWTMAKEGSKRVEISGTDDKRQITAVFAVSLDGSFLPIQLIYCGKSHACLPPTKFPSDWHITYSHNHWANENTSKDYVEKIILPYLRVKRQELNLTHDQHALCIFDNFKGQVTDDVLLLLERNHVDVVFVPPNCTDRLQPLDLSVNKPAKDFLRDKFQHWYSDKVFDQLCKNDNDDHESLEPIKFPLQVMKPLGAQWIMELHAYMLSKPEIIKNGFRAAGITDVLSIA